MGYTIWENAITFRAQKSKPLDSDTAGRPALRERERERESPEKWELQWNEWALCES
jgi:hypothetical protein